MDAMLADLLRGGPGNSAASDYLYFHVLPPMSHLTPMQQHCAAILQN
jgi:hypothetical protein